jgi:predicted phage replisome organizer
VSLAEVKWIKIVTDVFDDEKILLIDSLPECDGIIVIWFKLLCMAGKQNNGGVFMLNDKLAYTDEMLSTIFRRPLNTVRLALQTFEQFGMIELINDVITIPNWEKHQNLDKLEAAKEKTRNRVAKHREKQKALTACNDDVTLHVTQCNATDKSRVEKKREEENRVDAVYDTDSDSDSFEEEFSKERKELQLLGGLGKGVVLLSLEQTDSLLDKLGFDGFNYYIEKLAYFIINNNAKVSNHYATILKWAREDAAI